MFSICIDLKKKWYEQIVVTQNQCCSWECIVVSPPHVLLHHSHSVYFSPGSWSPAHPSHQHRTVFCHRGLRRAALASGHTLLTWCEPCDLGNLSSHSGVFNISTFISLILQVFFFFRNQRNLGDGDTEACCICCSYIPMTSILWLTLRGQTSGRSNWRRMCRDCMTVCLSWLFYLLLTKPHLFFGGVFFMGKNLKKLSLSTCYLVLHSYY